MTVPPPPDAVVIDTDVLSFVFNRDPVRRPRYSPHIRGRPLILPFVVVGEMLYGAAAANWGPARRHRLEQFIQRHRTEYPSYALCTVWAEVRCRSRQVGRPIERQDAWVAATALYLDLPLVTHNARHYAGVPDIEVITVPDILA